MADALFWTYFEDGHHNCLKLLTNAVEFEQSGWQGTYIFRPKRIRIRSRFHPVVKQDSAKCNLQNVPDLYVFMKMLQHLPAAKWSRVL